MVSRLGRGGDDTHRAPDVLGRRPADLLEHGGAHVVRAREGREEPAGPEAAERPQVAVPAGSWFGTALVEGASHCLVGCTVAPGFEFADFELAEGPELEAVYPAAADRIRRMRRPR